MEKRAAFHRHGKAGEETILQPLRYTLGSRGPPVIQQQGTTMWSKVRPWKGLQTPPLNGNGAAVSIGCAPATTTRSELSRRRSRGQGQTPGRGDGNHCTFSARVVTNTNHTNPMKSTRAACSSRGAQWGLSEMPDVATQAHRWPRSQGSDHGSKSQRASTEKRARVRHLPSHSNSTRKGTHHIVKGPDQAGKRVLARGPSHLHPTRGSNLTTTCSYVEGVRGVAPRNVRPTMATGPPHNTRYNLLPRAPTHTLQQPVPRGAPILSRSSTHSTHCATQHPPRGGTARSYPTADNTRHNPHPCTPCVAKGTQHAQQRHEGEGGSCCARQRKD